MLVTWYGLFIVLGVGAGALLGYFLIRRSGLRYDEFIQIVCFAGLGVMAGSKLLYLIISWDEIDFSRITDPDYLKMLMGGGFVFYGGLIGGITGIMLCKKILHIPVDRYISAALPVVPLAHAFGRIGCAFVGCCYGIPYSGPFSVVYTKSPAAPNGIPLFPVQALEAVLEFMIAALLCIYIAICTRRGKKARCLEKYLILYAAVRFWLEFLRYDDAQRGILWGFSVSQWISIIILAVIAVKRTVRQQAA